MFSSIGGIIIRCCMQIFIITIYPQITKLVLFVNKLTSSFWTWNPSLLGLEQWPVILCVVFRNNQPHHTTFARDFPKSGTDLYKFHFHTLKHRKMRYYVISSNSFQWCFWLRDIQPFYFLAIRNTVWYQEYNQCRTQESTREEKTGITDETEMWLGVWTTERLLNRHSNK